MKNRIALAAAAALAFAPLPLAAKEAPAPARPEASEQVIKLDTNAKRRAAGICMALQQQANRSCTLREFKAITRLAEWDAQTFMASPQAQALEFATRLQQILNPPKVRGMQFASSSDSGIQAQRKPGPQARPV